MSGSLMRWSFTGLPLQYSCFAFEQMAVFGVGLKNSKVCQVSVYS